MLPKAIRNENDIKEALKGLLLDGFAVYGDDASLFAKIQEEISHNTYSEVAPMCYIRILSVLPEENQPDGGKLAVYSFGKDGIGGTVLGINLGMGSGIMPGRAGEDSKEDKAHTAPDMRGMLEGAISSLIAKTIPEASFFPVIDGERADNQAVLDELKRTRLLFQVSGRTFIVSQFALATLGQRLELKGKAIMDPCLERDVFIAKRMDSTKNIQFITKRMSGLSKVFMAASDSYKPLSMTTIERIYHAFGSENGIGEMRCEGWEINHSVSRIRFSFLDYEKTQDMAYLYGLSDEELPVPCVEIISSDIGDYAFTIRGFWKLKRGYLYSDEVSRKHSGSIDEAQIIDEVKHTIFERYTMLPDRFIDLLGTDITPASVQEAAVALSVARDAVFKADAACGDTPDSALAKAREDLAKAEKQANKQFKDHTKLLSEMIKRVMKEIATTSLQYKKDWTERITADLNPASSYTAYDIMTTILDTQIMTRSDDTAEKMRKSMIRLPYLDYGRFRNTIIDKFALFGTRKAGKGGNEDAA